MGDYTIVTVGKVNIRFRKFTTLEIAEAEYLKALSDGWSSQASASKAGLNYGNFLKCLRLRPEMLLAHIDYIRRTDHSRSDFIYDKYFRTYDQNNQAIRRDQTRTNQDGTTVQECAATTDHA